MEVISWRLTSDAMGVTALCVADAAGMLAAFNPPVYTIRGPGVAEDTQTRKSIYGGMAMATGISLTVALGGTLVTRSWWPLIGTIIGLIVLCAAQEWAIRNPYTTVGG